LAEFESGWRKKPVNRGFWYAVGAYVIWGIFPVYWKWLQSVPSAQLLCHRILWSFLLLFPILLLRRDWGAVRTALRMPRIPAVSVAAALLLGVNWLTYVWAVDSGYIVECSLGYFINPLLNVFLGVLILKERLRAGQWIAILLAAGVLFLTVSYGALPWIALTLAFSFAFYALIKKTTPLGSVHGLTVETGILVLPALLWLFQSEAAGQGAFLHQGAIIDLLLIGAGAATAVPLVMFAEAAKRIPLSLVGVLQYIAPILQFLLGVLFYGEPFTRAQAVGFGIVWAALILFTAEGLVRRRANRAPAVVP
jgi:chloramphenicol-sensitive protein RarD